MSGIHIPALGRKFRMLIDYGNFKDLEEMADLFGVTAKTLKWWGHGDAARPADTLPGRHLDMFLQMIGQSVSGRMTAEELKVFAFSSIGQWEDTFRSVSTISLSKLIESEAITECAELFLQPLPEADLIETEKSILPEPELSVSLNTWFRLEVSSRLESGHVFAVQNVLQNWGSVAAVFNKASGIILLPGILEDTQEPAHMRERQDTGLHRFIVFQTPAPPPADYKRYQDDGIQLDAHILTRLAAFYDSQNRNLRRLYQVNVDVVADTSIP